MSAGCGKERLAGVGQVVLVVTARSAAALSAIAAFGGGVLVFVSVFGVRDAVAVLTSV